MSEDQEEIQQEEANFGNGFQYAEAKFVQPWSIQKVHAIAPACKGMPRSHRCAKNTQFAGNVLHVVAHDPRHKRTHIS